MLSARTEVALRRGAGRRARPRSRPRKLVIQIPCLDEAQTLPEVLADLPREVPGVDVVEWLLVDDGSTDDTARVARAHGIDHVVRFAQNRGLARAFEAGIDAALALGADIVVNTDGDHQYRGADIAALVAPIVDGRADVVLGDRRPSQDPRLPWGQRALHRVGSWTVGRACGADVADAPTGFRAYSRRAARALYVHNDFTYTLETLVQAGMRGDAIATVPVRTNAPRRPSRLFRSTGEYVARAGLTLVRSVVRHRPLEVVLSLAGVCLLAAFGLGARFLVDYVAQPDVSRHVQSLILVAMLGLTGVQLVVFGLVADLIATNRRLLEDTRVRVRGLERRASDGPG